MLLSLYQNGNDLKFHLIKAVCYVFQSFRARTPRLLTQSFFFFQAKFSYIILKKRFFILFLPKKLSSFFFSNENSVLSYRRKFLHLLFFTFFFETNSFSFSFLKRKIYPFFFFLRFFTSLKLVVPLYARSLISDETA